jgi:hypothetical protein
MRSQPKSRFRAQVVPKIVRVDRFHVAGHVYPAYRLAEIEVFLTPYAGSFSEWFAPRVVIDKLFPNLTFFRHFPPVLSALDIESYPETPYQLRYSENHQL